jgi:hypothetical protein
VTGTGISSHVIGKYKILTTLSKKGSVEQLITHYLSSPYFQNAGKKLGMTHVIFSGFKKIFLTRVFGHWS